jgi:hypothetical protein
VGKHKKQALEDEPEIPQNPLKDFHTASFQPGNGKIYDKKPFRMKLEKGKTYVWCLCGQSKSQVLNRQPHCILRIPKPAIGHNPEPIPFSQSVSLDPSLCCSYVSFSVIQLVIFLRFV